MASGFSSAFSSAFGGQPSALSFLVTEGYGNGTFNGTIPLVVTSGYSIGAATIAFALALRARSTTLTLHARDTSLSLRTRDTSLTLPRRG